jgi:hypothetical protein
VEVAVVVVAAPLLVTVVVEVAVVEFFRTP